MKCPVDGEEMQQHGLGQTLLGGANLPGHLHDDNSFTLYLRCSQGHELSVPFRVRCPAHGCDWAGEPTTFKGFRARFLEEIP